MRLTDLESQHVSRRIEHLATALQGLVVVLSAIEETTDQDKREKLKAVADYHRAQVTRALDELKNR